MRACRACGLTSTSNVVKTVGMDAGWAAWGHTLLHVSHPIRVNARTGRHARRRRVHVGATIVLSSPRRS